MSKLAWLVGWTKVYMSTQRNFILVMDGYTSEISCALRFRRKWGKKVGVFQNNLKKFNNFCLHSGGFWMSVCVPMMYCILFGVRSKKLKENKVFLF